MSGQVVHTIQNTNGSVTGIVALNGRLYVSYVDIEHIAVYSTKTFQHQQHLNFTCQRCSMVHGSLKCQNCYRKTKQSLRNMVGCGVNNCLYASDKNYCYIWKGAIGGNNTVSWWRVDGDPQGLSVTSLHNLLVAVSSDDTLREYSTDGKLIRQISCKLAGISRPMHVVQLSNYHYAVTHHSPKHQFTIISADGQLVGSYHSDVGHMKKPRGIAVDKQGRMLVTDQKNDRILVIDGKTLSAYPLPVNCQLNGPYSIHYDSANRRLYIGEWNGGRIVCCKL